MQNPGFSHWGLYGDCTGTVRGLYGDCVGTAQALSAWLEHVKRQGKGQATRCGRTLPRAATQVVLTSRREMQYFALAAGTAESGRRRPEQQSFLSFAKTWLSLSVTRPRAAHGVSQSQARPPSPMFPPAAASKRGQLRLTSPVAVLTTSDGKLRAARRRRDKNPFLVSHLPCESLFSISRMRQNGRRLSSTASASRFQLPSSSRHAAPRKEGGSTFREVRI